MRRNNIVATSCEGKRSNLYCARSMPQATTFLWNRHMLLQLNCQGYAIGQHMQPEPGKYSHGPMLEQRTFMQPEPAYYAHHPGRFVYVKDATDGALFSAPHAPVGSPAEVFEFSAGDSDVLWRVTRDAVDVQMQVHLPADEAVELWQIVVTNRDDETRELSIYPTFSIGYMSWMNQSAGYDADLGGIVAACVTPYQKLGDYPSIRTLKDSTVLLHDSAPDAWETSRVAFEGAGGIHAPDAVYADTLGNGDAIYESPIASLQYRMTLAPGEQRTLRFVFGPARSGDAARHWRDRYLVAGGFEAALQQHQQYLAEGNTRLATRTPDVQFSEFVNHWLGRQVLYHGQLNRMTTDPQTRNFLQDAMGMTYLAPATTRAALITALTQQQPDGGMPEGVLLDGNGALKYINQIPHTDHCVWLPICLQAYLSETADYAFLAHRIAGSADGKTSTVHERITHAMQWLIANRNERHLSLIAQGDWCDPMNMVGHRGDGVSGWLSIATVHALNLWREICDRSGHGEIATDMHTAARQSADAVQAYLWQEPWFARGITDDGRTFGTIDDSEGSLFLNPQTWAIIAGIANDQQQQTLIDAIESRLTTPYGVMLLAPSFTHMHEDIGRLTQKFPGTAENGSVYNHAAMFYVYALFQRRKSELAFAHLRRALPSLDPDDLRQRGQLPVFIPNYYRGAYREHPRTAGRSSQLFHTGAASWMYRIVIEQLFGLRGCDDGLLIDPQLPAVWDSARIERTFRGAQFHVTYERCANLDALSVEQDKTVLSDNIIRNVRDGNEYQITVKLPMVSP